MVSVQNLRFHYDKAPILDIPRWTVETGERIFLHGPSGAGKSTLLNLLAGILLPDSGTIEVQGKAINTLGARQRDKWRARHIGVVFQQFNLIPYLGAVDNIRLAAGFAGATGASGRARELLLALGLAEEQHHQSASRLSIGQQQRVAIARALVNRPALLIADEPTSALDRENRDAFLSLLLNQAGECRTALVFVSHDLALADRFSRTEALADINRAEGCH
ncbi:ABC transporter ATP-binding protein [Parahaliea mediterranea]|uniref:ABC transporter ATP-binding protein n=1 Tax=Parahaliea mediterranea TaxID=651086 RepID=UPI00321B3519